MNTLTIVIVNHNSTDFLKQCLDRLHREHEIVSYEVIVVDNGSQDQEVSEIRTGYPRVGLIRNRENRGFSSACNQGLAARPAAFYLLLNPDCFVEDRAVAKCLEFLGQNPRVGVLGCRVNNPDGSLQAACRRQIPRPTTAFYHFVGLSRLFPTSPRFAAYNLGNIAGDRIHEVDAVSGSFLMFRHAVLEDTGGLDERFFLYGEDLDFCYRAALSGWKVIYYPEAQVTHHKGASATRSPSQSSYHFYHAMELFYRKHFYPEAGILERTLVLTGIRILYLGRVATRALLGKTGVGFNR